MTALSEREPNVDAVPQAAEALAAGLGTEPPSRSENAAARTDWRIRLTAEDEQAARALAFNGGRYPHGECYRLLRLALHEIDCLTRPASPA